jgi:hypothetical protein
VLLVRAVELARNHPGEQVDRRLNAGERILRASAHLSGQFRSPPVRSDSQADRSERVVCGVEKTLPRLGDCRGVPSRLGSSALPRQQRPAQLVQVPAVVGAIRRGGGVSLPGEPQRLGEQRWVLAVS